MSCDYCVCRLEKVADFVNQFWYAYDHFGYKLGFPAYRDKFISLLDLSDYCYSCKFWYPLKLRNYLNYEAKKRSL